MRPAHINIRFIDSAGFVIGLLLLHTSIRLADLESLRPLGAFRAEVAK